MRDEHLIRGNVPMTKSEVRAVSLSKLGLEEDSVFYDIGAGTGSVSIEAALNHKGMRGYAIEQSEEGAELIRRNQEKFKVENIEIIRGMAPDVIRSLPVPTHVLIGGSGGKMEEILDELVKRNQSVMIVINIVSLETLMQVTAWCSSHEREAEIVCIQVSKAVKAGKYHLMQGQNPVYIVSFGGKVQE